MNELLSEKEQLEQMRAWWSENGRYVIGGIVIGAGLLFGWNQYQDGKLNAQVEASGLFESLAGHVDAGYLDQAQAVADELAADYGKTSYSAQSKLAMARLYMDQHRDQDAVDVLNQMLAMPGHDELKHVGRLRLAKILLYQDRPQEVIDMLEGQDNRAFAALYADVLGDAHAALGDFAAASDAYQRALTDPLQNQNDRGLVQMKLMDLPQANVAGINATDTVVEPADAAPEAEPDASGAEIEGVE